MKTLIFCARDIRDYLGGIIDARDLNSAPDLYKNFSALTDAPDIQKFAEYTAANANELYKIF